MGSCGKSVWLEFIQVCNVSVNQQIAWQFDACVTLFFVLFFIDLNDANYWLAFNLWVVVNNHVQTFVNRANPLRKYLLHCFDPVLLQFDILAG
jgi:hypothetical protein